MGYICNPSVRQEPGYEFEASLGYRVRAQRTGCTWVFQQRETYLLGLLASSEPESQLVPGGTVYPRDRVEVSHPRDQAPWPHILKLLVPCEHLTALSEVCS